MERREPRPCSNCGNTEFVRGIMEGYANVKKPGLSGNFTKQSPMTIIACKKCGLVASMWIDEPESLV